MPRECSVSMGYLAVLAAECLEMIDDVSENVIHNDCLVCIPMIFLCSLKIYRIPLASSGYTGLDEVPGGVGEEGSDQEGRVGEPCGDGLPEPFGGEPGVEGAGSLEQVGLIWHDNSYGADGDEDGSAPKSGNRGCSCSDGGLDEGGERGRSWWPNRFGVSDWIEESLSSSS